jgi:hypothetical protein
MPVIHHKRSGKAEQRLDRQERHLPATLDRTPHHKCPELITGLADRKFQIVSQISHAVSVLPGAASTASLRPSSDRAAAGNSLTRLTPTNLRVP